MQCWILAVMVTGFILLQFQVQIYLSITLNLFFYMLKRCKFLLFVGLSLVFRLFSSVRLPHVNVPPLQCVKQFVHYLGISRQFCKKIKSSIFFSRISLP